MTDINKENLLAKRERELEHALNCNRGYKEEVDRLEAENKIIKAGNHDLIKKYNSICTLYEMAINQLAIISKMLQEAKKVSEIRPTDYQLKEINK